MHVYKHFVMIKLMFWKDGVYIVVYFILIYTCLTSIFDFILVYRSTVFTERFILYSRSGVWFIVDIKVYGVISYGLTNETVTV